MQAQASDFRVPEVPAEFVGGIWDGERKMVQLGNLAVMIVSGPDPHPAQHLYVTDGTTRDGAKVYRYHQSWRGPHTNVITGDNTY